MSEILAIADGVREQVDLSTEARTAIANPEQSAAAFQKIAFERLKETNSQRLESTEIGMSDNEVKQYNIARAIQSLASGGKVEGFEREVSDQMAKVVGRSAQGFYIPQDFLNRGAFNTRTQVAGTANVGGNLVSTNLLVGNFIELLRNRTVVRRLGATVLSGLTGNVSIPRQLTASTANARGETEAATKSSITYEQVNANPHSVSVYTEYSKRLIAQSALATAGFFEDDMTKQLAIKQDLFCLNGSGSGDEPLGIMNTTGVNSVTFGGAATFGKMVDMETAIDDDNALMGAMAYVTTPTAKGKLKQKLVASSAGSDFVWTTMRGDANQDGEVNGYRAACTKQVPGNKAIFGNWADSVILEWAGLDVTIDLVTKAEQNVARIIMMQDQDHIVRRPQSFCVSSDTAAA